LNLLREGDAGIIKMMNEFATTFSDRRLRKWYEETLAYRSSNGADTTEKAEGEDRKRKRIAI